MNTSFNQTIRRDWKNLAQKRELDRRNSPAAPSIEEVEVFRKFLHEVDKNISVKPKKVLVLGITPEMREIAWGNGYEVVSVDIDKNMIKSMKDFVKIKGRETIINDNWLNLEKYYSYCTFDLILADASLNNLSFKDYQKILKIMNELLKDDGYFIVRHFIIAEKDDLKPIDYFCKKKVFWKEKSLGMLLGVEQIKIWLNDKKHYLELGKYYPWLLSQLDIGCLSKDMETVRDFTSTRNLSVLLENDFFKIVQGYFKLINKGNNYNFGLTPIFVFKKK